MSDRSLGTLCWGAAMALAIAMVGCATRAPATAPAPAPAPAPVVVGSAPPHESATRSSISIKAWLAIDRGPSEAWTAPRSRLYTYVLSGDLGVPPNGSPEGLRPDKAQAYRALGVLLREVRGGVPLREGAADLDRTNAFCIPARKPVAGIVDLPGYDFELAGHYLNAFRVALEGNSPLAKHLDAVGPFLLATREPIGEILRRDANGVPHVKSGAPVMVVDMSGRHEDAIPVYVSAFNDAVSKDLQGTTVLASLRADFASAVLVLNRAVPFVADAYAKARPGTDGAGP